ncbi:MAG TPA: NAD-dependent epimerase/dehydratase family protein [Candidatus Acidoferrales bacterium]|nr:NAD-dependent epimerase/dehydratase family protein [Candidatus Acidoferrales bacterium]
MQKVFVTGANGLIGSNLCHRLTGLGYEVVALVRRESNLLGLRDFSGKTVYGSILDQESLSKSMDGAEFVFHAAGLVTFDNRRREELFRVNVEGTRNVMNAALKVGVKKVVHTSSVAAIGVPSAGDIADETVIYNREKYNVAYSDSKHFGEVEVEKAIQRGLNAVIVNPASIVGQRDVYSHFGILLRVLKGKKVVPYVSGGMCVVGIDDVVEGEIAALKCGRIGEKYILGSENISFKDLFEKIGEVVGSAEPNVRLPIWMAKAAASLLELLSSVTGKPPVLTKAHVVSATLPHYFSSENAKRELGFQPHPIMDAIKKAYDWYVENNLI